MDGNGNPNGYNHSDHGGAVALARRLREYWLNRGYNVETTVASMQADQHSMIYAVRSNLIRGLPPGESKVLALAEAA